MGLFFNVINLLLSAVLFIDFEPYFMYLIIKHLRLILTSNKLTGLGRVLHRTRIIFIHLTI